MELFISFVRRFCIILNKFLPNKQARTLSSNYLPTCTQNAIIINDVKTIMSLITYETKSLHRMYMYIFVNWYDSFSLSKLCLFLDCIFSYKIRYSYTHDFEWKCHIGLLLFLFFQRYIDYHKGLKVNIQQRQK